MKWLANSLRLATVEFVAGALQRVALLGRRVKPRFTLRACARRRGAIRHWNYHEGDLHHVEMRLRSIQSAAGYVGQAFQPDERFRSLIGLVFWRWNVRLESLTYGKPGLRFFSFRPQTAFFRAVDLYHETVLHDDVHGSESQAAKRVADLDQCVVDGAGALVVVDMRLMCYWLRHRRSFAGSQPPALPGVSNCACSIAL
jgi:hypothetical protein